MSREKRVRIQSRILVPLLYVLLVVAPAKADEFTALVGRLAGNSFADKEKAVTALGAQGDPRAVLLLQAMTDGRLLRGANGRVVVSATSGGTTRLRDAGTARNSLPH